MHCPYLEAGVVTDRFPADPEPDVEGVSGLGVTVLPGVDGAGGCSTKGDVMAVKWTYTPNIINTRHIKNHTDTNTHTN